MLLTGRKLPFAMKERLAAVHFAISIFVLFYRKNRIVQKNLFQVIPLHAVWCLFKVLVKSSDNINYE